MTLLLVLLGAAVGAPLRYLTDRALQAHTRTAAFAFPAGTIAVNVAASFVLGVVAAAALAGAASHAVQALIGTGFCGALSTYSTFSYETMRLAERDAAGTPNTAAVANVVISLGAGLGAAFLGAALGHTIWP